MEIIRSSEFKNKYWSGGITTELYIYPKTSSYASLNFAFRLSRATIEIETSVFTKLKHVNRRLMLTKGKLKLIHRDKYSKALIPYQTDQFSGNWHTDSVGKAEDVNLMLMQLTEGYLESLHCEEVSAKTIDSDCDFFAICCLNGSARISKETIFQNDLAVLEKPNIITEIEMGKNTDLVLIRIWLNT